MKATLTMKVLLLLGFASVFALPGCETTVLGDCPPGTKAEGEACVLDPDAIACGEGTVARDGKCVPAECAEACEGRVCGPDGCGGSCGSCEAGEQCTDAGQCEAVTTCFPSCWDDALGAYKECGDDGCGGSCGACQDPSRPTCDEASGRCLAVCIPDCVGRQCGDDGCGGTCGACDGTCTGAGKCVPAGWTCEPTTYGARDACDCGCGADDPDCASSRLAIVGCEPDSRCTAGVCVPRVPAAWTCSDLAYDDGIACDCGCGVADPDCDGTAPVLGCQVGETCGPASTCVPCTAACDGKVCGPDGCGGSCGSCDEGLACVDGGCIEGCRPTPIVCQTNSCGDDGCGGSCGECPENSTCISGQCEVDPGYSCAGYCKTNAPAGCGCDFACIGLGDCCPDYVAECVCIPDCAGKTCGDDGCGGTCGLCDQPGAPFCGPTGQCQATCSPQCTPGQCGDDGCGGQCSPCGVGETCNAFGICAPATWTCPAFYYGDGGTCDCGCGAVDPDCDTIGLTDGCPLDAECSDTSGYCDIGFCGADSQCTAPNWCVGHYLAGDARRRGVCQPPEPSGLPEGAGCGSDYACASGLCAGGLCRSHCRTDSDCELGAVCIGFEIVDGLTLASLGVVTACDASADIGASCTSQAGCPGDATCLAFIGAGDLGVTYRCATLDNGEGDEGRYCESNGECPTGLVCADNACMRACPAGNADCPPFSTCGEAALHGRATALQTDDVEADVCVPN